MISIKELQRLCALHWNPIGIPMELEVGPDGLKDGPLPDDEYDNYLTWVREMLKDGATDAEIVAYLDEVEREDMGLGWPSGDKDRFAAAVWAAHFGPSQLH